ncbi:MAG TPA: TolC family protein [Pyrinomonadaceae bacterium]|nr:TolC family protein [Pyrinomonadaceae bacterium]
MRSSGSLKKFTTLTLCLLIFVSGGRFFTTANSQTAQRLSEATEQLTLTQAVELALRTNPSMKVTAAGRQLADAQFQEARTGRWPSLQAAETFTRSNNPVFVFGSLLEQGRFGPENFAIDSLNHPNAINNFRSALTLRLPLIDQRQTETRTAQARIAQQEADQQTEMAAQQLRFAVIRTFYGLLLAQARLEVSDEAVKTAEADVKRARDIFESGLVVQSDLLAAEVQLSEFRQQQIQAKGDLVTAMAALNTAMGLPVDSRRQPLGQLVERAFPTETVETLSVQALQDRPDYQRAVLSARARQVRSRGARGELLPRVDAFVTAGASGPYVAGGSGDYAAGASITFNVFDAGRKARIDQSRAAESIANAEQEQLANQIRFEVMRAYQQYVSARERMAVVAQITAQATETLRMVQDRYHAGLTTITELLRAQTALVRARSDVLTARYDQYVGYANVLLAAGRLKDVGAFGS